MLLTSDCGAPLFPFQVNADRSETRREERAEMIYDFWFFLLILFCVFGI